MNKEQAKKIKTEETLDKIQDKAKRLEALINLSNDLRNKERRIPISFNDFLHLASTNPEHIFRDIFQLFYDMIKHYVPEVKGRYQSGEDYGFEAYDTSKLFVKDCNSPFFADRLFANRLVNLASSFRNGNLSSHIFLFEGPPGSGKSTFLNNLLKKLEDYAKNPDGIIYKVYWRLDIEKLGGYKNLEQNLYEIADKTGNPEIKDKLKSATLKQKHFDKSHLEFSCPRHDHPILLIPKEFRQKFLDELISDESFKKKLFNRKEYEWVLKDIPCSTCYSIYSTLLDRIGDPLGVFSMLYARQARLDRQMGEGVTVFNPGDPICKMPLTNYTIQNLVTDLLENEIKFTYSYLSKTNNGVFALMDIKENNIDRLNSLHGIISDGVHKVELIEERIKSLFVGLVNPGDKVHYEKVPSFRDRIITVNIPYILDYKTEVEIYKNKFGQSLEKKFLPKVLQNFARVIISTRLEKNSQVMNKWVINPNKYSKFLDKDLLLLKMEVYAGRLPGWLEDEEINKFTKELQREIFNASEKEGQAGFSGRQSLNIFNDFITKYNKSSKLLTMADLVSFFTKKDNKLEKEIPPGFLKSLEDQYDYYVLQELKDAIYYYNEVQIARDIKNYLFAINFEVGDTKKSTYTGDNIDVSEDYFKNFEAMFLGTTSTEVQRKMFRKEVHSEYISKTLSQEIRLKGFDVTETEQFKKLFERYTKNLKENAFSPYADNQNFRRAIKDFNTEAFNTYDSRLKMDIEHLIKNLKSKFKYTEEGAIQICLYTLDTKLINKF